MSVASIAGLLSLALSLVARHRRAQGRVGLDDLAIALGLHVAMVGALAVGLAWAGVFGPWTLGLGCAVLAVGCWPWRASEVGVGDRRRRLAVGMGLVVVIGGGVALRLPPIPAPLAGRDQGTYVLRAQATLRTGSLGWTDPLLAEAGRELASGRARAGTYDLLGLYPIGDEPWRRDHYDGAYRPGAYLGDRERGEIVPQFFHLHPMLLAVSGAALGPARVQWISPYLALVWLASLAGCALRVWPRGPWAVLAVALVAGSPLAIWVSRTPLSENPMALFESIALLAALRMRDGDERAASAGWIMAACLTACALTRGNALIMLPIVLALLWLRPRDAAAPAAYGVLAGLCASVVLHAATTYPYVHDELLRQLPDAQLGPLGLMGVAGIGVLGWVGIDRLALRLPGRMRVLPHLPRVFVVLAFAAALLWWWLRAEAPPGRPFSRLDAAPVLLGVPLLAAAALGLLALAWRWRPGPEQAWLLALLGVIPMTMLLYAPRQLPTLAFFYYGRYLVPELLPAAAFAATGALACVVDRIMGAASRTRWRAWLGGCVGLAMSLGLLGSVAWPLVEHPQLRLREYVPAGEAVAWLADRLPADAIVIAGGEGWHSGHTHNQVGGALAMGHGVEVLPYRTREDAWISAWELLVERPAQTGEAAPPVFLLVNEAAHQTKREDGQRVALLDEQLWAPFVVERASLLELFLHALTPVPDQLPTRVARHELRMALLRLRVDADALADIETVAFDGELPIGVEVRGGLQDDGGTCLSPERPLVIELPRPADAAHLVVVADVADERMSRHVGAWSLVINGVAVGVVPPPGLPPRPRATLGPVPLPAGDRLRIELLASTYAGTGACPHGRVAALRLLPRERSSVFELDAAHVEVGTIVPELDLGHAIEPTIWVTGRSVSRYRPGTTPTPELAGLGLVLRAEQPLSFAPIDLPLDAHGRPRALDVIVTLSSTATAEPGTLRVFADGELLATIETPATRAGSWIAKPIAWQPERDRVQLTIELDAGAGEHVGLRDIALFGQQAGLGPAYKPLP